MADQEGTQVRLRREGREGDRRTALVWPGREGRGDSEVRDELPVGDLGGRENTGDFSMASRN